jgi:hypothetical protein
MSEAPGPPVSERAKKRAEAAKQYIENMFTDVERNAAERRQRWA